MSIKDNCEQILKNISYNYEISNINYDSNYEIVAHLYEQIENIEQRLKSIKSNLSILWEDTKENNYLDKYFIEEIRIKSIAATENYLTILQIIYNLFNINNKDKKNEK